MTPLIAGLNKFDQTTKELDFVINGAGPSKFIEADSTRCRYYEATWCIAATVAVECTGTPLLWSDPATWTQFGMPFPAAGADVEIPSGVIVIFDLAESPKLNLLKIVGCLRFLEDNSSDQILHAYQIFVFGGKLDIGSLTTPYSRKAEIVLYGAYNDQFITMPGATEAGNKMIANVGQVKMIG